MKKNVLVFDATPLIYLAKAEILEKILLLFEENIIIESVCNEVVGKGKVRGENDAFYVEKLIQKKVIFVKEFSEKSGFFVENKKLSETDDELLRFCKKWDAILITDDEELGKAADKENRENHGSVYLLFILLNKKIINKMEFKQIINKMIKAGWYCSIEFYDEIMGELEKI